AALGSGLAIGCVQWLPAALQLGVEHGATVSALPLARLLELIVPGSFGAHDADRAIEAIAGRAAWAPSLFVGAPLLALAAVRPPARRVLALVGTFAVLALVVGRGGWPAWLGAPELHLAALVVVLAGTQVASGLDALVTGERRAAVVVGVAIGCTTIALVALGVLRARNATASTAIDRALVDGCIGLLCTGVALALAIRGARRTMPIVLALLVLPSLGATGSIAPVIDRDVVVEPPAFAIAAQRAGAPTAPIRVFRPKLMFDPAALAPPESLVEHRKTQLVTAREHTDDALATFANAAGARWGIANAESTDPARPAIHDRVWLAAARQGGVLLDRFGIALAILPETLVVPRGFTALEHRGEWALVTLPVAPPAAVLRGWMWSVDPDNALALLFPGAGAPLPRGTVVLRGGGATERDHGPPLPCTIERWDAGDIALACESDRDGYAVVSSTATAGWTVTVDDADATWLTADVLRRAVAMPAGRHQIAWRYTTPGLGAGFVIACIGVMLLIALWLAGRKLLSRPRS
ncbi:MAG TPA: hypothetical protein VFQ53_02360, partial [Kofleriaceae bacterium]|nr:hypothetical protein [Kofleriaceae bacterium]